jgi:hypothetical protein
MQSSYPLHGTYVVVFDCSRDRGSGRRYFWSSSQVRFDICYSPHRARNRMNSYVLQIERVHTAALNSGRLWPWLLIHVQICRTSGGKNQNCYVKYSKSTTQCQHSPCISLISISLYGVSPPITSSLFFHSSLRMSRQLKSGRYSRPQQ